MLKYTKYNVNKFTPHLFTSTYTNVINNGCGGNVLSMLTGINPVYIKNSNKENPHDWRDEFMLNFLRRRKFNVIPITRKEVTNCDNFTIKEYDGITSKNVLLLSQHLTKKDATWSIIYKEYIFHNFDISRLSYLEFINNPILTAYVIFHKDWM